MHYLFNANGEVNYDMVVEVAKASVTKGRLAYQSFGRGSYLSYDSALAVSLRDIWASVEQYRKQRPLKFERRELPRGFDWFEPRRHRVVVKKDSFKSSG